MGKVKNTLGRWKVHFDNGQGLVGKFFYIFSLLTFMGVFNFPKWSYFIVVPLTPIVTIIIGYFYDALGIRRTYDLKTMQYWMDEIRRVVKEEIKNKE